MRQNYDSQIHRIPDLNGHSRTKATMGPRMRRNPQAPLGNNTSRTCCASGQRLRNGTHVSVADAELTRANADESAGAAAGLTAGGAGAVVEKSGRGGCGDGCGGQGDVIGVGYGESGH